MFQIITTKQRIEVLGGLIPLINKALNTSMVGALMSDLPIRAFETKHDIMGFEFESGSMLYLKASENVELGQAVICEKEKTDGSLIALDSALLYRDGSLVYVNSEDFDDFINNNNIAEPMLTD